jgi:hypothetical protein
MGAVARRLSGTRSARGADGENMARDDRHGNREAKKAKKLKPKEIGPISTLASIQKKALEATNPKKN